MAGAPSTLAYLEAFHRTGARMSAGIGENECPCTLCDHRFHRTPTTENTEKPT